MRTMTLESLFVTPDYAMCIKPFRAVHDHGCLLLTTREKMISHCAGFIGMVKNRP